jgi:phosphopantothenoylcysteine decarboxylase/phosphopantothenate--cysteine ligase
MVKSLKNKKILITGGPVWVPLDKIRVITNVFTGALGLLIAKEAAKNGAMATLLLGPSPLPLPTKLPKNLKIIRFNFFEELCKLMKKEISSKQYDIVIHSAAVADFIPKESRAGKISSTKNNLTVRLKPTQKIADKIKVWAKKAFLVNFKLEVNSAKKELIKKARKCMLASRADLMVANDYKDINIKKGGHKAFIVDRAGNIISCRTKKEIAEKLLEAILEKI